VRVAQTWAEFLERIIQNQDFVVRREREIGSNRGKNFLYGNVNQVTVGYFLLLSCSIFEDLGSLLSYYLAQFFIRFVRLCA
jgi:hypothetical protein